jgi:hypothetical protein
VLIARSQCVGVFFTDYSSPDFSEASAVQFTVSLPHAAGSLAFTLEITSGFARGHFGRTELRMKLMGRRLRALLLGDNAASLTDLLDLPSGGENAGRYDEPLPAVGPQDVEREKDGSLEDDSAGEGEEQGWCYVLLKLDVATGEMRANALLDRVGCVMGLLDPAEPPTRGRARQVSDFLFFVAAAAVQVSEANLPRDQDTRHKITSLQRLGAQFLSLPLVGQ